MTPHHVRQMQAGHDNSLHSLERMKPLFLAGLDFRLGFPAGASSKEPACQCRRQKRCKFDLWVKKIPWRRTRQPTPVSLPGESHGQRSLVGYSPWGHKNQTRLSNYTRHFREELRQSIWGRDCAPPPKLQGIPLNYTPDTPFPHVIMQEHLCSL